jgi:hypothetical protein
MKFTRLTAGYSSLDRRRDEDIWEELKVDPVEKKLAQYKQKWLNRDSRLEDIRYPKQLQTGSGAHPALYPLGIGGLFPGVKRPEREVDHTLPSDA